MCIKPNYIVMCHAFIKDHALLLPQVDLLRSSKDSKNNLLWDEKQENVVK